MSLIEKKELIKIKIKKEHGCKEICSICAKNYQMIDKMYESNIPIGYWFLNMKSFIGSQKLKDIVEEYINNIDQKYYDGKSICFSGNQGTGKTMSSICILKQAIKKGYSVYYITALDLLNEMVEKNNSELRKKLKDTDFLVIDELDSRFFISNSSKELFSGIYENIFRTRAHNTMPTILCSNETNSILDVFYGAASQSIESLNKQYLQIIPVAGFDFRKKA